jgi:RNA polymerase sigma-70 factor (ECF subfamily)
MLRQTAVLGKQEMAAPHQHDALFALRPAVGALVAHVLGTRLSDADVEDCTSEAFRRALEHADRLREGAPLRPWLLGIAHHVALDLRRSRARALSRTARPAAAEGESLDPLDQLRDHGPSALDRLEISERKERVQAALQALPEDQRRVLVMHAQGRGYREIADELSLPIGTVCTWISRARKQLASTLSDQRP